MSATKEELIIAIRGIIKQYGGMKLTVRQIYYRLVSYQHIENSVSSYQRIVKLLGYARKNGLIRYSSIEDRTREVHQTHSAYSISKTTYAVRNEQSEESVNSFLRGYLDTVKHLDEKYLIPKWYGQPKLVQVWVEKEALSALFQEVTDDLGVDLVVCRGYPSLTLLHDASVGLNANMGKDIQIIYFGDFDPSGADIERNVFDTLDEEFNVSFEMERKAITRDQIEEYNIPPAPAKTTDSRYEGFVEREGVAWQVELDAIEPMTLQEMIRDSITQHFDKRIGKARDKELEARRAKLKPWVGACLDNKFQIPDDNKEGEQ